MKKIIYYIPALLCVFIFTVPAQGQLIKITEDVKNEDWYNQGLDRKIFGAAVDNAHEFLKNKKVKKNVIVSIIGPGMDVSHPDLEGQIWKNPKEKINQLDDDKNGWVDDVHGWNFLGAKDGRVNEEQSEETEREFVRLKDRYGDIIFNGKDYFRFDDTLDRLVEIPAPIDLVEYEYYRTKIVGTSRLASHYGGLQTLKYTRMYAKLFDQEMKARYPSIDTLTIKELASLADRKGPQDSLRNMALTLINVAFAVLRTDRWDVAYRYVLEDQLKNNLAAYEKRKQSLYPVDRDIVGDDPNSLTDIGYGNSNLMSANAGIGTLLAGVIGATRNNGIGIDGIAAAVSIMPLRVLGAESGEAYLKDVALAIRYAVDNKADVILLTTANYIYPPEQAEWVYEALEYAQKKNVTVVIPVKDYSFNLALTPYYPAKQLSSGRVLDNVIVVAGSDRNGNPLLTANYGKNEVDLFAPSENIYSTFVGNTYRHISGSLAAGATTAGVVALLKNYYPDLTAQQIYDILISEVNGRGNTEVEKSIRVFKAGKEMQEVKDLIPFHELCISGGIIDAEKAVRAADRIIATKP